MDDKKSLEWMLWQIPSSEKDSPPALALVNAIKYYIEKFGVVPNCCEVPISWKNKLDFFEGVEITHSKNVHDNNLMLTRDD